MTCIRDITDEEQLEREFDSIRQVLKDLNKEEKPLRIEWGTREAMEKADAVVDRERADLVKQAIVAGVLLDKASEFRSQNLELAAKWIEELVNPFLKEVDMKLPQTIVPPQPNGLSKKQLGIVKRGGERLSDNVDFERATDIAIDFLRKSGHSFVRLETSFPYEGGWDFHFDVGAVSKKILAVGVSKTGEIKRCEPLSETVLPPPEKIKISREDHAQTHKELHKALDELTADYIRITGKLLGETNILELMEWSNRQTKNPETKRAF